ncbi:hypothetical protein [Piscinibacter sp.]|uniref:hypothetical protein n=1 Tax=Piscinibacter sp. TaxID=1903157 RepID=UPI002CEDD738|nr:hypothetical protein [Albitalea sp.]HUG21891.1 hypothetical protein [Albitalea sp.]
MLKDWVAGIAMGLIVDGDRFAVLTDILGNEDHIGDMDLKVAGTADGITLTEKGQSMHPTLLDRRDIGSFRRRLTQGLDHLETKRQERDAAR